jgi:hypothetical protein
VTIILAIIREINGQALRDRQANNRAALRNNSDNPLLRHTAERNHYVLANIGNV